MKRTYIYFGHSRRLYDTDDEADCIAAIRRRWPEHYIVNPNTSNHQAKCLAFIKDDNGNVLPGREMEYFLYLTLRCKFGVFLNVDELNWTPGSAMELRYMRNEGKKTYIYNQRSGKFRLVIDVPSERTFEDEHLKLYGEGDITKI